MHLDTVVARHYHLQTASSFAARKTQDMQKSGVTFISSPPGFPLLEEVVDVRIPMHFAHFDFHQTRIPLERTALKQFQAEVETLFTDLATPFNGQVHLCRTTSYSLKVNCGDEAGPVEDAGVNYVAVVSKEDALARWKEIHEPLKALIQKFFTHWKDPAIRYLREPGSGLPNRL